MTRAAVSRTLVQSLRIVCATPQQHRYCVAVDHWRRSGDSDAITAVLLLAAPCLGFRYHVACTASP